MKEGTPAPLLPGFVVALIQTPFFLDLVEFNRVGTVKQPHVHQEPVSTSDPLSSPRPSNVNTPGPGTRPLPVSLPPRVVWVQAHNDVEAMMAELSGHSSPLSRCH